jgi:hypothetical protein
MQVASLIALLRGYPEKAEVKFFIGPLEEVEIVSDYLDAEDVCIDLEGEEE